MSDRLYRDVRIQILNFLSRYDRLALLFVSKDWNLLCTQLNEKEGEKRNNMRECSRNHYPMKDLLIHNSVSLLEWLVVHLKYPVKNLASDAGKMGSIEILEWLHYKGYNIKESTRGMAVNGHFKALKFVTESLLGDKPKDKDWHKIWAFPLTEEEREWFDRFNANSDDYTKAMKASLSGGQLENAKYLQEKKGVVINSDLIQFAFISGDAKLINWVLRIGKLKVNQNYLKVLSENGHWDLFWKYFKDPAKHTISTFHAATQGNIGQISKLVEAGVGIWRNHDSEETIDSVAANNGQWEMLYWLYEQQNFQLPFGGRDWYVSNIFEMCLEHRNFEAFKWYRTKRELSNNGHWYKRAVESDLRNVLEHLKETGIQGEWKCYALAIQNDNIDLVRWLRANGFTCEVPKVWPFGKHLFFGIEEGSSIKSYNAEVLLSGNVEEFDHFYSNSEDAKLSSLRTSTFKVFKCQWESTICDRISPKVHKWIDEHPSFNLNKYI
eukprot:TRINITY_DN7899_c0_g3_i1.p1 TRINITY_DN7899_c0_g3~~TRINITY_DN7899_c0_g3_i1.p1  ORF type:complete len:494 (+),score=96.01 TRINITY_DN7899_c0_g3_i1:139-1620(+)